MTKQLNIRSDEAHALAHGIADRLGTSVSEAVLNALRAFGHTLPPDTGLSPTQQADLDAIRALVREGRQHRIEGASSDHSYLYDENGLPI